MAKPIDTFLAHGLDLHSTSGTQARANCIFCDDTHGHFFINVRTGQWDCKHSCGSGNAYTFISKLHEKSLLRTTRVLYQELSEARKIPIGMLKKYYLAKNFITNEWLLPTINGRGSIVDLRRYSTTQSKTSVKSTPNCSTGLFGFQNIKPDGPIYICEGEWDAMSLDGLLTRIHKENYSILAVPGANVFKKEWCLCFHNRDLYLLYDNDEAGLNGIERAKKILSSAPKSVTSIDWPASIPEKYDIRDFVNSNLDSPRKIWKDLKVMIREKAAQKKIERTKYEEVVADFKERIHWNEFIQDAFIIICGASLCARIPGDPVWLFLTGPPGVGKSLLLKCLHDSNEQETIFRSNLTSRTLVSGASMDFDPSLLPKLEGKSLIIKDYTAVTTMGATTQEELYGILRDIYDGFLHKSYGNGVERYYEQIWFSLIAGVTDVIHSHGKATLGERFLKFEMIPPGYDAEAQIRAAIGDRKVEPEQEAFLQQSLQSYIRTLSMSVESLPSVPSWVEDRIVALAQIVALLRAGVDLDRSGELAYRPRPEIATRIAKQLTKLSQGVCKFLQKEEIDVECYRLILQCAMDTCIGWTLEVFLLHLKHPAGLTTPEISQLMQVSESTVRRTMETMQLVGSVVERKVRRKRHGAPLGLYFLSEDLLDFWDQVHPDEVPVRLYRNNPKNTKRSKK